MPQDPFATDPFAAPSTDRALEFGAAEPALPNDVSAFVAQAELPPPTPYQTAAVARMTPEAAQRAMDPNFQINPDHLMLQGKEGGNLAAALGTPDAVTGAGGSAETPIDPYKVDAQEAAVDTSLTGTKTEVATSAPNATIENQIITANDRAKRQGDQAEIVHGQANDMAIQAANLDQITSFDSDGDGIPDAAEEAGAISRIAAEHEAELANIERQTLARKQESFDKLREIHAQQYAQMSQAIQDYGQMTINPNELWDDGGMGAQIGMVGAAFLDMNYGMLGWTDGKSFGRVWDKALESNIAIQRSKMEAQSNKIAGFEKLWQVASDNANDEQTAIENTKALLTVAAAGKAVRDLSPYKSAAAIRDKTQALANLARVNSESLRKVAVSMEQSMQNSLAHANHLMAEQTRRAVEAAKHGAKAKVALAGYNNAAARHGDKLIAAGRPINDAEGLEVARGLVGEGKDVKMMYLAGMDADGNSYPQVFFRADQMSADEVKAARTASAARYANVGLLNEYADAWEDAIKEGGSTLTGLRNVFNKKVDEEPPKVARLRRIIAQLTAAKVKDLAGASFTESEQRRLEAWLPGDVTTVMGQLRANVKDAVDAIRAEDEVAVSNFAKESGRYPVAQDAPEGSPYRRLYDLSRQMGKPVVSSHTSMNKVAKGKLAAAGEPAAETPDPSYTTDSGALKPKPDLIEGFAGTDTYKLSAEDKGRVEAAKANRGRSVEDYRIGLETTSQRIKDERSFNDWALSIANLRDVLGGAPLQGFFEPGATSDVTQGDRQAAQMLKGDSSSIVDVAKAQAEKASGKHVTPGRTAVSPATMKARADLSNAIADAKSVRDQLRKESAKFDSDYAKDQIAAIQRRVDTALAALKAAK